MKKIKLYAKFVSLILIVTVLFTACDIPDISEFTETSAETTTVIRQGVKETGNVLETFATSNFVNEEAKDRVQTSSANYSKTVKPTLKALDALDAYLEALNALALSNKKSQENAEAAVNAVSNLVTAVSGLQIPDTALRIGTVFASIFNQIKTSKDFKKRVTLVDLLVNGGSSESDEKCVIDYAQTNRKLRNALENMFPDIQTQRLNIERPLNLSSDIDIDIKTVNKTVENLEETIKTAPTQALRDNLRQQKNRLSQLQRGREAIQQIYDRKIVSLTEKERTMWLQQAGNNFCGVIDILKLNMKDLGMIQDNALGTLHSNIYDDNLTLIRYYNGIKINDKNVMEEISLILDYKSQLKTLEELKYFGASNQQIQKQELTIRGTIKGIYVLDPVLRLDVCKAIPKNPCVDNNFDSEISNPGIVKRLFEEREGILKNENDRLLAELKRIEPEFKKVDDELKQIKTRQRKLNDLFANSIEALDIWGQTHSNLRVALNTKQSLTVSRLKSKKNEIVEIIKYLTTKE